MSKSFSSKASQTNGERIEPMQDEDIDLYDIPEVTEEQEKLKDTNLKRLPSNHCVPSQICGMLV